MNCDCGTPMKLVPKGVSKAGNPYNAFYSCQACGITKNPEPNSKPVANNKPSSMANPEMMRLAYRKDLMVAIVENIALPTEEQIKIFDVLWSEVEK